MKAKTLVLSVALAGCFSSCSSKSVPNATAPNNDSQSISSTPPFQTREPDKYQAVRTTTFVDSSGHSTTTKTMIARDGVLRREETDAIVLLDTDKGRFLLQPQAKIYADTQPTSTTPASPDPQETDVSAEGLLHQEPISTRYEKVGEEVVSGRNTTKYRATVNISGAGSVSSSETLIWIDEKLGMPIKSETKGNDGSQTLIELSNILLEVDESLFKIPADYKKVAIEELQRQLRKD